MKYQIHMGTHIQITNRRKPRLINPIAGGTAQTFSPFLFLFGCSLVCTFARTNSLL